MKKLLALLIAVMMVVALLPATVLSAIVPALQSMGDEADTGVTPPAEDVPGEGSVSTPAEDLIYNDSPDVPDERLEAENAPTFDKEFTEGEDKLELVNKKGELVGYFTDLPSADKWVRNGDTLRFLADITLAEAYVFGTGREELADQDNAALIYVIDGNGKTVHYRGEKNFALFFGTSSRDHNVTIKDLTVNATKGAIGLFLNHSGEFSGNELAYSNTTGGGATFTLEDCKLYANDSYYYADPAYYAENNIPGTPWIKTGVSGQPALYSNTGNTMIAIKGAETAFYGNSSYAVDVASVTTIHDGFFYSMWADATVQVNAGSNVRNNQKLIIYGGTFVNDRLSAVRAMNGCQLWVFGGDFIMTAETATTYTDMAVIRTSNWNATGYVYILGGNFYMDTHNTAAGKETGGAAVWSLMEYSPAYIAGGNFYHSKADNAFGGHTFNFSRFSKTTSDAVTENNTKEVYSYTAQKSIAWNYVTSVSFDGATYGVTLSENGEVLNAAGEVLFANDEAWYTATGAEVAILDANGAIIDLLDVDNETGDAYCIHYGLTSQGARATTLELKLKNSWHFVPNGGTWRMITDITSTVDPKDGTGAGMFNFGQFADVNVDGNGHTLSYKNTGKYYTYCISAANVTFTNIVMVNPTGRGLQFGNLPGSCQTWTLGKGAVVRAGDGSAVYMCPNTTLNVLEGAVMEGTNEPVQTWHCALVQLRPNTTFNLLGGTLRADDADVYGGPILYALHDGEREINLISGEIYLIGDTLQALRMREGDLQHIALNVTEQVKFYTVDGTPALQPLQGNAAEVTNEGEAPVEYATFAEALAAVKPGAVVKLLRDVRTFGTTEITCDMTLLGNGYTIYDASLTRKTFMFHIRGAYTDVLFDDVTLVTAFGGIYVSQNEVSQRADESSATSKNDSVVINVTLNNCKVVAAAVVKDAYDYVDQKGGESTLRLMKDSSLGALYQHGEGTYVKITGEKSFYACSNVETIVNFGGFLDIYDGFVYGFAASQVMLLRGRQNVSEKASNQMRSATTAIYNGVFMGGSQVGMSVARTLRGHAMIIMDGEFILAECNNPADNDRHVIRVSDSNRAGYLYVMGGDFYQPSGILPVFGWGLASVAYIRIWGGNFWGNCPTGIQNRRETSYSFNNITPGLDMAYGTYIDAGYKVTDYTYTENDRAYPERTNSDYVKEYGYLYHQSVDYDEAWLVENGYMDEGIAYIVTGSQNDTTPTEYYSFEFEKALFELGNGGTFTLVHDVTLNQPAKLTTTGEADTDYGFFGRYRPADSSVIFNTQGKKDFYTITTNVDTHHFLTLAGGSYTFQDFGVVNNGGALLKFADDDMSVKISGGRYLGRNVNASMIDTNGMLRTTLIVESGEFEYDGEKASNAMFQLRVDAKAVFGIEGTKIGPTIYKGSMLNAIQVSHPVAGEKGGDLTIYYADMVDVGFDGRLIAVEGAVQDFTISIYDGEFLLNNTSYYNAGANWTLIQAPDNARGVFNFYGGNFTREGTGQGRGNNSKMFIFENDGVVNFFGGTYRQNMTNVLMSVRKNGVLTVNMGDPTTGEGPVFRGNGSTMISMDNDNTTTAVINVYAGTYTGNKGGIFGIGKSTGVAGTVNVYGGQFTLTSSSVAGFDAGNGAINFYNGTISATGSGGGVFTVTGAGAANIYDGTFTANNKFLSAVKGSTFNVYGGNYTVTSDFLFCGDQSSGSFTLNLGMRDGSSGPTMTVNCIVSTYLDTAEKQKATNMAAYVNIYACNATITSNGYACYGRLGVFNVYGGDFLMTGQNRLFRIGGYYEGEVNIYGGNLISNAGHCLAITDNSTAKVVLGKPDGTGPVMLATKNATLDISTNGKVEMTIYGGTYTTEAAYHTMNWVKSGEGSKLLIEDGQFYQNRNNHVGSSVIWLVFTGGKGEAIVNGGSYYANNNANSCFYLVEGSCTVNGGYYYSNGMSTIGVIGGSGTPYDADYNKGYITTPSTAALTINGGVFFLDSNWQRSDNADTNRDDAVLRAGGGTGYGTVVINGGTYISASKNGARIINKINGTSSVKINGGVFMASERQEYYFYSAGNVYDVDGNRLNAWLDPANIPVNRQSDRVVSYNGASYHVYMLEGESTSYINVTSKAAIRIVTTDTGVTKDYVSGLRFTTTIDGASIQAFATQNGVAVGNIIFGTLIVPEEFLQGLNAFTHADLTAAGLEFLDVLADKSLLIDPETGDASFTAAITEILPENYGRRFVAVGYMMVAATEEQAEVIGYATHATGTSLAELAVILLENEINNQDPYSAELKALLQAYAAALPEGGAPEGGETPEVPDDTENDDFDVIGGEGDGDGNDDDDDDDIVDDDFVNNNDN